MSKATNEYYRQRMAKLKEQGICTQCSKNPASPGFVSCKACRDKARVRTRALYGIVLGRKSPRRRQGQPIVCPLCESIPSMFYWHHWDDEYPEIGMWLCPYCNHIVELEERGLVDKYRELKNKVTNGIGVV